MIKKIWDKISVNILQHKITSIILAIAVLTIGYYGYGKLNGTGGINQYVLAAVQKGMLVSSVSGSGQVSASDQVEIKSKSSGQISYIAVKEGQWVGAGTLLIKLDAKDAEKTVRDAQINLESAKLSMEKLKQSSADMARLGEDSFNAISDTFLDLPAVMSGANIIINGSTLSAQQSNLGFYKDFVYSQDQDQVAIFISAAVNDYNIAREKYDKVLTVYKDTNRYSAASATSDLLNQTVDLTKAIAQALKSEQNLLDYLNDYVSMHNTKMIPQLINTYRNNLQTYIGQTNNHISSLISMQNTIKNAPLDISSQELSIKQRENALLDAQENLANYYIRAPFSGVVAKINVKVGDSASASVVTFITHQKIAQISLNEVDIAKIKIGQKTTLTFDAVPDLTITGEVAQIDTIGVVTQGVVTYNVKIAFDTQDDRIKPGMSVSAAIITDTEQDILLVPNSAVKSQGGDYYVEILNSPDNLMLASIAQNQNVTLTTLPTKQSVQIGGSNDLMTEISGGLKEGDIIIARTITTSVPTQTQQTSSSFRIPGIGGNNPRSTGGMGR